MGSNIRFLCTGFALLCLANTAFAQSFIGTDDIVEFDSPEGWAMAYMTAAALNLGQAPPQRTAFGRVTFAAEAGSIPSLNADQQIVGFSGFKHEDLNKSPVFGRARASLGLFWDVTAEVSWTPPIELEGAKPDGLWGFALSRPLLGGDNWGLGVRLYALQGDVNADVSCSAEIAAVPEGSAGNPFGCRAPSDDRLEMDHYGGELILSFFELPFGLQPWVSVASTRMDPFTEVRALALGSIDISTVDTRGTAETYSAGLSYRLSDSWRINLASSYTPLDAERTPDNPGGQDNFWNVRLGLTWEL